MIHPTHRMDPKLDLVLERAVVLSPLREPPPV